jgi:hypothetical protein
VEGTTTALEAEVAERAGQDARGPQPETDLEYDLAHEWVATPHHGPVPRPGGPVQVATETNDRGSDYGYDMAHDVPRR